MSPEAPGPKDATLLIRRIAAQARATLVYKLHARERLVERGLIISDVLHVLKHGFVYERGTPAKRAGFFRHQIECPTPNSGSRTVGVVVIPDEENAELQIVTVMWIDEQARIAGTILGENDADG